MLSRIREKVQSLIVTEVRLAHSLGFTPNMVSTIGILFALFSALTYLYGGSHKLGLMVAPIFLLASGFCDVLDGALARIYGEVTTFGSFLDSLLDRYADAVVLCGIMIAGLCDFFWGLTALTGSLLVSYTRARGEALGVRLESKGMTERAERLIILATVSFLNLLWPRALSLGVLLLGVFVNLTVLQRAIYVHRALRKGK